MNQIKLEIIHLAKEALRIKMIKQELEQELFEIDQKIIARDRFIKEQEKNSKLTPDGIIINGGFYAK